MSIIWITIKIFSFEGPKPGGKLQVITHVLVEIGRIVPQMITTAKELDGFISQIQAQIGTIDVQGGNKQSIIQNYAAQSDLTILQRGVALILELSDIGKWLKTFC